MTGTNNNQGGRRAFTLIEVVVAMLLLAIGLLGLMALQIRSIHSNSFSNYLSVASSFARDKIEALRADSAADWDSLGDGTFTEPVRDMDPDTGATRMVFTREWVIQTDLSGRKREVAVTVSWTQGGISHKTIVNTTIAKRR